MKKFLCVTALVFSMISFADAKANSADWVVETGTMIVEGVAANDLYFSLNAPEVIDPLSTNYDQLRTKENVFAKCAAHFDRVDSEDGDTEWVIRTESVKCLIQAPNGSVINE